MIIKVISFAISLSFPIELMPDSDLVTVQIENLLAWGITKVK